MGSTYYMLNIHMKHVVLIYDFICIKKTYVQCVSRYKHTKADYYVIQNEYEYDNWDKVNIDPINTENFNRDNNFRKEEDVPKTIHAIYFVRQEKQENKYHHDTKMI